MWRTTELYLLIECYLKKLTLYLKIHFLWDKKKSNIFVLITKLSNEIYYFVNLVTN